MIIFWISAAAMTAIALLWIIPSLVRKPAQSTADQYEQNILIAREKLRELEESRDTGRIPLDDFESTRAELEQGLAFDISQLESAEPSDGDQGTAHAPGILLPLLITFLVPVLAGVLYLSIGTPAALFPSGVAGANQETAGSGQQAPNVDQMMAQLKDRLKANPDNARGWRILARSSMSLQRYDDAVSAFEQLNKLVPNDADILVQFADALAMQAGGSLGGRTTELLNRALEINPDQPQGLWLSGMAAERRGEFQIALNHWNRLMPMLSEDPQSKTELAGLIRDLLANAKNVGIELDSGNTGNRVHTTSSEPVATTATASIRVTVSLAPELASETVPDDTVFVFARATDGPSMPLAAAKKRVADLPFEVSLDDSSAMLPNTKLSSFENISIVARISKSGQPTAISGDLEGRLENLQVDASSDVKIVISKLVP